MIPLKLNPIREETPKAPIQRSFAASVLAEVSSKISLSLPCYRQVSEFTSGLRVSDKTLSRSLLHVSGYF